MPPGQRKDDPGKAGKGTPRDTPGKSTGPKKVDPPPGGTKKK